MLINKMFTQKKFVQNSDLHKKVYFMYKYGVDLEKKK